MIEEIKNDDKFPLYVIGILTLVFIVFVSIPNILPEPELLDKKFSQEPAVMHIHTEVEIEILGEKKQIPKGVGIDPGGMRVIHTHSKDGKIHVESPKKKQFYLKDFFYIWGKNLNESCVLEYCEDKNHELVVSVNGEKSDKVNVPLRDRDKIKIIYKKRDAA